VFKIHPREDPKYYEDLLTRLDMSGIIITQKIELDALLQASSLVVTAFSTVALEAMILDRPVLIVNLSGEPDPIDFVRSGAALAAYTPENVALQLERLLTDAGSGAALAQNRRQYIRDQMFRTDGQAAQRVADLILQMSTINGTRNQGHFADVPC
jgi:CDP-glycerol glycerophosphotransferase (TagB/SpsB family)